MDDFAVFPEGAIAKFAGGGCISHEAVAVYAVMQLSGEAFRGGKDDGPTAVGFIHFEAIRGIAKLPKRVPQASSFFLGLLFAAGEDLLLTPRVLAQAAKTTGCNLACAADCMEALEASGLIKTVAPGQAVLVHPHRPSERWRSWEDGA